MGFLKRVLSAAVAELHRQGAVKERERLRLESEAYAETLAATIKQRLNERKASETADDILLRLTTKGTQPKGLN